jgi:hypothetical protein
MGIGINQDGRLEIFARGTDNALWHSWQHAAGQGPWAPFSSLGGDLRLGPAVARNAAGGLEVFSVAADYAIWHHAEGQYLEPMAIARCRTGGRAGSGEK